MGKRPGRGDKKRRGKRKKEQRRERMDSTKEKEITSRCKRGQELAKKLKEDNATVQRTARQQSELNALNAGNENIITMVC